MFGEFLILVEGEVDVFVKVLEVFLVGLGFQLMFIWIAFFVTKGGGFSE